MKLMGFHRNSFEILGWAKIVEPKWLSQNGYGILFFCLRLRDYCSNSCFKTSRCFALPAASAGVLRSPLQYAPGAMLMISALFALLHAALTQPFTSSRALHAAIHEQTRAVNTIDGLHHPSLAWINLDPLNCFIGTPIYTYIYIYA